MTGRRRIGRLGMALGALACVALLVLSTGTAHAAVHRVPQDFATIQAAIDAAVDGDVVQVGPGTYQENIVWETKAISLVGTGTVDGGGAGSCLVVSNVPAGARIEGLTFTGGQAEFGGGIHVADSSVTLVDCAIRGNSADWGGAVHGLGLAHAHCLHGLGQFSEYSRRGP